ncbi:NACHT domain-containing protein [Aurantiacibacter aquimixticola]|uniref:NACHT domain-containing protein n=1 Tax=Aurantiacibacter aquimixticola TaxID=1958945 RepID=A0A419RSW8_9SPHN|nr:NACHT domain-containing protein [Aurantiacibacter aquimixticola]RJY08891.1 NACHT domain-containing protein [Aurantiacibacter aquimixticola]
MALGEAAAAAAAVKVVDAAAPRLLTRVGRRVSKSVERTKVLLTKTFQNHLEASNFRARWVKTIVSKDKPVDLENIYVGLLLENEVDGLIADSDIDPTENPGSRVIVSGTGGAGKTVLMKKLLLDGFENRQGLIPLFVELRNLSFDGEIPLAKLIFENLADEGGPEGYSLFETALEEGLFPIFLDGFDEINPNLIDGATKQISKFSRKYKKCSIIISTRPGTGIHSLTDYSVYHLQPLSKEQALELIEKTRFEAVSKSKFLTALKDGLYEKHQSMMSIPILVVMMLLTFRSYGEIPSRMTVFYSQAFDTLYSIHDAEGKESYKRVHDSGLPPDQFRLVLNAFCYSSLCEYEIEFNRESLELFVSKGIRIARAECSTKEYISDLIKNVCVLQPDGLSYLFVHRSFQEYFAATFVSRYSGKKPFAAYDQLIRMTGPDLHQMLVEIDRPKLYRQWLLPKLEKYYETLDAMKSKSAIEKFNLFAASLVVRTSDYAIPYGMARTDFTIEGLTLAHMTDTTISPATLIQGVKFSDQDLKKIQGIAKKTPPRSISKGDGTGAVVQIARHYIQLSKNEVSMIGRSNFDGLFRAYLSAVEDQLSKIREIVAKDVIVEDLIFD